MVGAGAGAGSGGYAALTAGMRRWFVVDSFLVGSAGVQLYVLSEHTDRFFAWTVVPPLTAAFLGGAYWASLPLLLGAAGQGTWAHARLAVYGVLLFTIATLAATLLHLQRFHLGSPDPVARGAAWAWIVVYVVVPPALLVLLVRQRRVPGGDPPRRAPLPGLVRLALAGLGASLVALGAGLLLAPAALGLLWPWPLTPLTGRAVGAWLVGIGVIAGQASWENDAGRVRGAMWGLVALGGLELVALARYPGSVDWGRPGAWVYVLALLAIAGAGLGGALTGRPAVARRRAGPAPAQEGGPATV
jgi:hypothetical protein